jgi:hypothetical protein
MAALTGDRGETLAYDVDASRLKQVRPCGRWLLVLALRFRPSTSSSASVQLEAAGRKAGLRSVRVVWTEGELEARGQVCSTGTHISVHTRSCTRVSKHQLTQPPAPPAFRRGAGGRAVLIERGAAAAAVAAVGAGPAPGAACAAAAAGRPPGQGRGHGARGRRAAVRHVLAAQAGEPGRGAAVGTAALNHEQYCCCLI